MAQLNDLLVMGQSTLLGPTKIDSIVDKNGDNGATNSGTIDKVLKILQMTHIKRIKLVASFSQ